MITFWKLWVWRMAYRDSRRGLFRLLLSMSCVVLAVALVVLAFSFRENLLAEHSIPVQKPARRRPGSRKPRSFFRR